MITCASKSSKITYPEGSKALHPKRYRRTLKPQELTSQKALKTCTLSGLDCLRVYKAMDSYLAEVSQQKKEDGVDTVIVVIGPVNRHPTSSTQTHDFYLYKVKTMA
jgi:hypothetical protein